MPSTTTVKLPAVALDATAGTVPSRLQTFDTKRNPFKPLRDIAKAAASDDTPKTVDLGKSPTDSTPSSSSSSSPSSGSGSSSGSGGSSSGGSGTGGSTGSVVGPQVTYYTYTADISFGEPGHEKTNKAIEKFTLLGSDKAPAAVYEGITDDTKFAVFAIDVSTYEVAGEGECKPADDDCRFVYLSTADDGNETTITSLDGATTYNLKLLNIKRVKIDAPAPTPTTGKKVAKNKDGSVDATDAAVSPRPTSLFEVLAQQSQQTVDTTERTKK